MARSRPSKPARKRTPRSTRLYVTRRQFEAVLAIIEKNTKRIDRLEDVFAMQAKERGQVKQDLGAMKATLRTRRRRTRG